jgi:hypothetical protein
LQWLVPDNLESTRCHTVASSERAPWFWAWVTVCCSWSSLPVLVAASDAVKPSASPLGLRSLESE